MFCLLWCKEVGVSVNIYMHHNFCKCMMVQFHPIDPCSVCMTISKKKINNGLIMFNRTYRVSKKLITLFWSGVSPNISVTILIWLHFKLEETWEIFLVPNLTPFCNFLPLYHKLKQLSIELKLPLIFTYIWHKYGDVSLLQCLIVTGYIGDMSHIHLLSSFHI